MPRLRRNCRRQSHCCGRAGRRRRFCKPREHDTRIAVDATLKRLVESFADLAGHPSSAPETILESVRSELGKKVALEGGELSDYASTLLFASTDGRRYLAGQLGDGMIAVQGIGGANALCEPARGEYKNETVFVTTPRAARFFCVAAGSCSEVFGFVLMSDGSAESLYHRASRSFARAIWSLGEWLDQRNPADVSKALAANIQEIIRQQTGDDCSLGILRKVVVKSDDLAQRPSAFQSSFVDRRSAVGLKNMLITLEALENVGRPIKAICTATGLSETTVYKNVRFLETACQFTCRRA